MEDVIFKSDLAAIRDQKGLSLYKIAKDIDEQWQAVKNIELGQTKLISAKLLKKLCIYLEVTSDKLIYFPEVEVENERHKS